MMQKHTPNLTTFHNESLWKEWYSFHMEGKPCTFLHKDKLTLGRIGSPVKFIELTEPGFIPNYVIEIMGPSGQTVKVEMLAGQVKVYDDLEAAEEVAGYTWNSRLT
jgi:hypothetical protein